MRSRKTRATNLTLSVVVLLASGCGRVEYDAVDGDASSLDAADVSLDSDTGGRDAIADTAPDTSVDATPDTGPCAEDPCRLFLPQCGCASGQMCGWNTFGPRQCVAPGTGLAFDGCARDHECVPGGGCIFLGPGPGVCQTFCEATAACPADSECVRVSWPDPVGICSALCDPVAQTGCPSPTSCGIGLAFAVPGDAVTPVLLCANAGPGDIDDPCSGPLDCGPTLACYGDRCRPICRMGDASTCATTCGAFAPPTVVGTIEYGACF